MALPSSGAISLNQVNVELKKTATAAISMNDAAVRALAKVATGAISMSNLHGKSSEIVFTNTVARTQANIHTLMGSPTAANAYVFDNTATISAATQGGWALQTGVFPAGSTLTIINRGGIRGSGGKGGINGHARNGTAGGTALILNFPVTIDNTGGTIWGGGGGGGVHIWGDDEGGSAGGGGGAGMPGGAGGKGEGHSSLNGKAGTDTAGGNAGGVGTNRAAGAGGAPGAAGARSTRSGTNGSGGRGGYSVETNGNAVTWIDEGDRKGDVV